MPRHRMTLPGGLGPSDLVNLGALTRLVPMERVRAVLRETGRESERERQLPMHVMVYYVLALSLFMGASCEEVLRQLVEGLRGLVPDAVLPRQASKSSLSHARARLGVEPLRRLYEQVARPIATPETKGAFYKGLRLVAIDGTTLDVADTPDHVETFGRPGASRGQAGYPQVRVTSLVECGTHVLFASCVDGCNVSEGHQTLPLLGRLERGQLCLADRAFFSFKRWEVAQGNGAHLLWRVKKGLKLPCMKRLPDGSFLSTLHPNPARRGQPGSGTLVRVIEYGLPGIPGTETLYRLVTTLLDPERFPAAGLAALYHERWEAESALDELKTHLRGGHAVLRSQRPDLVLQEVYALLLTHFALRGLMLEAALQAQRDPDTLSFVHAVRVVRRTLPHFAAFSPCQAA